MQNIKSGKEEIVYLLTKAIEKYNSETGQTIIQNTNRKNYETLALILSEISNQLPEKGKEWGTEVYSPVYNQNTLEYPHRKYDITGGQIKDALSGIVSNPRPFLVDACYIYLYGMGRKAFKENPADDNLVQHDNKEEAAVLERTDPEQVRRLEELTKLSRSRARLIIILSALTAALSIGLVVLFLSNKKANEDWLAIKKDMNILPYQPAKAEIDSLEGVWLCYTGSPQARISDPSRYHKVVANLIDVKYKNGYFTFNRYGASFNHFGYMQFESPGIVSVYSRIRSSSGKTESPRHSLLSLQSGSKYLAAISASWNFDVGDNNRIIGIREVYIKLGKGGTIAEVINEIENASCKCKVIRWQQENKQVRSFYLRNESLDSLSENEIKPLINENSILLGVPQEGLVLLKDSAR